MAGETTKSTALASVQGGSKRSARLQRGTVKRAMDVEAIAAGELEAADRTIMSIDVPSNAILTGVFICNDALDSNGTPTLTVDVGASAAQDFKSVTSGTTSKHVEDDLLDADLYVDGSTEAQSANTSWTRLAFDAATKGPDKAAQKVWEDLGYDEDPHVDIRISVTFAAAAATAAAGDLGLMVEYMVD